MAISIKDHAVETMVRHLAKLRGVTLTEAVRQVLAPALASERDAAKAKARQVEDRTN